MEKQLSADTKINLTAEDRFQPKYIHLSELIYGRNFQSPGGEDVLTGILKTIPDRAYHTALDIGFGCGGNSIFLSNRLNCHVTGLDINENFLRIASERIEEYGARQVKLLRQSILEFEATEEFDIAISRDVFMYIQDKKRALAKVFNALKENGVFVLIDYCRNDEIETEGYNDYIARGNYDLNTLEQYRSLFEDSEFREFTVRDITPSYISYMEKSLTGLERGRDGMEAFKESDVEAIKKRTSDKITYCKEGAMIWGVIVAVK